MEIIKGDNMDVSQDQLGASFWNWIWDNLRLKAARQVDLKVPEAIYDPIRNLMNNQVARSVWEEMGGTQHRVLRYNNP